MTVQRVVVTRSGGFAGITRTTEVDDPEEAQRIAEVIRSTTVRPAGARRDDFVYEFVIMSATDSERIEVPGAQVPAAVRTALDIRHG